MVTSDRAANKDAAIHVAHAFTVHGEQPEQDYFTVVDDLKHSDEAEDAGAAGVFDTELTSGVYYGYTVIDVPQLVMNLSGCERAKWLDTDRSLAGKVAEHLVHLIAKVSPGAKRGSTAPYAHAEFVLVEMGRRQPRTLANAFRDPIPLADKNGVELGRRVTNALGSYLSAMDKLYGTHETRFQAALPSLALEGVRAMSLPELASTVGATIIAGDA
jgi:CRISPR system Cascade subunit CasC